MTNIISINKGTQNYTTQSTHRRLCLYCHIKFNYSGSQYQWIQFVENGYIYGQVGVSPAG